MKTMRIMMVLAVTLGTLRLASAQEIDWQHFDPKKASRAEMARVVEFLDRMADRYPRKVFGNPGEIKSLIINGNKITTVVYNYGNITRPNTLSGVADLVWNRLGYGFEFTPLVAAEVVDTRGDTVHIVDDGMWLPTQGGYAPDGSLKWGWLPKPGYSAPGQPDIAAWSHRADVNGDLTRKPHSWPESWYNPILGRYVWPAFLGDDATSPDEEAYFVCDDFTNAKYKYYPFPDDSTKRGLGLDLECRFFQFNNALAEDIIFLVYRVTNRSPKTLNRVYFGMYGDPHVGGANDYADDLAFFIPPKGSIADPFPQRARSMVYAWDNDGRGDAGLKPGYFGFKFLESPTNSTDGIDNDDDGIIDESPFNDAGTYIDGITLPLTYGIADVAKYTKLYGAPKPRWSGDEDGDWDPTVDDVGIDGLSGTGDFGEGNGKPDVGIDANGNVASEPHFGIRDVDESDQIGLTSFNALPYTQSIPNVPKDDVHFWQLLSSDSIAIDQTLFNTAGDNVFVYGSGPFKLAPGATQRFSVAVLMGNDLPDLVLNAEISQRVLEANYRFTAAPPKPNVTAVPGNGRVTLFWDTNSENTVDPLTKVNDFEGYKIYRSEDPTFSDVFTVTDANGNAFLGKPFQQNGKPAQFDLKNTWSGLHPVEYPGRGVKFNLGSNTGLVHEYVDSSAVNGKTYYYAVASYDHGSILFGAEFPPSESQAAIKSDPITKQLTLDVNTVAVTAGPLASGYTAATTGVGNMARRVKGVSTGPVYVQVLDDHAVPDNVTYTMDIFTKDTTLAYNVASVTFEKESFTSRDTVFVPLSKRFIILDSLTVRTASGALVPPGSYVIDAKRGLIKGAAAGALTKNATFEIQYRHYSVFESRRFKGEDDNPTFEGMRVFVTNVPLGLDSARSGFLTPKATNLIPSIHAAQALTQPFSPVPIDFEIRWNSPDTTANGKWKFPGDTLLTNVGGRIAVCPFKIVNVTDNTPFRAFVNLAASDSMWRPGREIIILSASNPITTYIGIDFFKPANETLRLPPAGTVFAAKTSKPFAAGDRYLFTTQAIKFDVPTAKNLLDRIMVVPNPYVAYSTLETPGSTSSRRGDNRLQFRNLPPECTIRIYTIIGELVDTIVKNDNNSYANWNLLSYEGQRLSYGVYIYHVDVPGVGEKIGRFALIK